MNTVTAAISGWQLAGRKALWSQRSTRSFALRTPRGMLHQMDDKMAAKVNSKLRAAFSAHRAAVAKHDVEIPRRRLRMAGFLEKGQMDSFNSEARGLERTEKQLVKAVERAEKLNSEAFAMAAMFGLTVMGTGADATCMSAAALASMKQLTTGLQPGMLGGQPIAGQRAVAPVGVGVPIAAGPVAAYAAAASLPVFAPAVPPMFDADPVEHPMVQPLGRQDYGEHLVSVGSFAPPPPNNPDYIPLPFLPASAFGSQPPPQQQPLQQPPQQQPQPRRPQRQSSELGRELLAEALRTTTACGMVKEGYMLKRGEGDASGFKRRFFRWCAVAELSARALLPSLPLDRVVFRSCSPSALTRTMRTRTRTRVLCILYPAPLALASSSTFQIHSRWRKEPSFSPSAPSWSTMLRTRGTSSQCTLRRGRGSSGPRAPATRSSGCACLRRRAGLSRADRPMQWRSMTLQQCTRRVYSTDVVIQYRFTHRSTRARRAQ